MSISQDTTNPLLKALLKVMPPTTIRLPSKGLLYKNGELDDEVIDGQIILYPMNTLDEIIIRNSDMLLQGTAIEQVIGRCAPQVKKPMELFSKDIDYILVFLRKISSFKIPASHFENSAIICCPKRRVSFSNSFFLLFLVS